LPALFPGKVARGVRQLASQRDDYLIQNSAYRFACFLAYITKSRSEKPGRLFCLPELASGCRYLPVLQIVVFVVSIVVTAILQIVVIPIVLVFLTVAFVVTIVHKSSSFNKIEIGWPFFILSKIN